MGKLRFILFLIAMTSSAAFGTTTRLKDLVRVRGVRSNFVNGFGLIVGLKSTGDSKKSLTTNKMIANMLTRMGMKTREADVVAGNMAAVLVTGELPPFARIGDVFDVKVSAIGDARSLAGGTLILTTLHAGNSEVFAVAQGSVVVGQASGSGPQVLTVARVPQGASVEREFQPSIANNGELILSLLRADFTTASRIAEMINTKLKGFYANPKDVGSVEVLMPPEFQGRLVEFIAELESMRVEDDTKAVVVVNERTGTVVMGASVIVAPVAIAHGDLTIKIGAKGGKADKSPPKSVVAVGGATVGDLLETLNSLGVKPADLVGILQSLHASGAINAELRFI
ncbi:MAG: flagellar basal body P-ring protein FlgI [Proteobacteria bacterium]|nr:flagellar basal body P-ring protein FlgI [Pseudomonadota bacterium]